MIVCPEKRDPLLLGPMGVTSLYIISHLGLFTHEEIDY